VPFAMPAVMLRHWKPSCVKTAYFVFVFLIIFHHLDISVRYSRCFFFSLGILFISLGVSVQKVGLVFGLLLTAFSALVFGLYSKMLDLLYIMFRHIHRCLMSKDSELQAPSWIVYM
jgi:hypothetical protein